MTALGLAPNYPLPKAGISFSFAGSKPRPVLFVGDTPFIYADIFVDTAPSNLFFDSFSQDPSGGVNFVPLGGISLSTKWVMSDSGGNVFHAVGVVPCPGPWVRITCGANTVTVASILPLYNYVPPYQLYSPSYTDHSAGVVAPSGVDTFYVPVTMAGEFEINYVSSQTGINANIEQYDPILGWIIRNRIQSTQSFQNSRVFLAQMPTRVLMQNSNAAGATMYWGLVPHYV